MNTGARLVKGLRSKHPPQRIAQQEHLDANQARAEVTTERARASSATVSLPQCSGRGPSHGRGGPRGAAMIPSDASIADRHRSRAAGSRCADAWHAGAGRGDGLLVEDHGVVSAISDSLCLCRLAKTQVPHATMALEAREPNREVRRSVWTT